MRKLMFFSLLALLFLAACMEKAGANQSEEAAKKETAVHEKAIDTENDTELTYTNVFPLTGEPTNEPVDHRIVSVMINNHSKARPQSGLSQADIVYEALAEGQITRFLALFHSDIPDTIGPVRSARPYYFELADGFDALYVYHGASTAINQQLSKSGVSYLDGSIYDNNGWLFKRSTERAAPHNSYFLTEGIERAMEQKGYENEFAHNKLPFDEKAQLEGRPVDQVTIEYSRMEQVDFSYDPETGKFLRSSGGEPTEDMRNEKRIAVENVLIIEADHQVIDKAGRREIDLTSGGVGYLLQEGQLKEIQWKNVDGRLLPFDDGEALPFMRGKTWVNIIPENAAVQTTYSSN